MIGKIHGMDRIASLTARAKAAPSRVSPLSHGLAVASAQRGLFRSQAAAHGVAFYKGLTRGS